MLIFFTKIGRWVWDKAWAFGTWVGNKLADRFPD